MRELDLPPGDPIEVGTANGSGIDQNPVREAEALPPELPPVMEPTGEVDSDPHDTATGDGWVPA